VLIGTRDTGPVLAGEYVVFSLGAGLFAVAVREVLEVVRAVRIAPLPGAPDAVEGLVNARGALAPVYDLRRRFGLSARPLDPDEHLVLARAGERLVAFRADRVLDLVRFPPELVEVASDLVDGVDHVAGIAKTPDGLVLIHDLTAFLSTSEIVALDAAMREVRPAEPEP
jgi:purine-binding chemotaxis protein CheW